MLQDPSPRHIIHIHNTQFLNIPHIDNATNAITLFHVVESRGNLSKGLAVGDELIDLQLAVQVVIDQARQLAATFDTTESTTFPNTTSNKLER